MRRVVVHIGELVLSGVDRADAMAVARALRDELGAQLGRPGTIPGLSADRRTEHVHAGAVRVRSGASRAAFARAVASAVVTRVKS